MSSPIVANIVNATIGLSSVLFHLWHYFRRGRNIESLWAVLISLSSSIYALAMFRLYQGVPKPALRPYFNYLYLFISIFFFALLGYAAARIHFSWPTKWKIFAGTSFIFWTVLIFLTPLLLGGKVIQIPLSSMAAPFAQIQPGLGISLFYLFHGSLAVMALWMINRHSLNWQTRPLYFNLALGILVLAAGHDVLVIHDVLHGVCCFFSEYSIALVSLVIFINSQEDSAGLVDFQQRKILNSQQDFSKLMQSSNDMIAVHQQGQFVFINQIGVETLGYDSPNELLGLPILDIVHPEDRPHVIKRIQEMNESKISVPAARERLLHKDGHSLLMEITGTRIVYQGQASHLVIARDLGARIEFESRMMQMDRMVAIGTLAAGVAHEINNPLTFVVGNLELIEDDLQQFKTMQEKQLEKVGFNSPMIQQSAELFNELEQLCSEATDGADRIRRTVQDLSALAHDHEGDEAVQVHVTEVVESALRLSSTQTKHRARLKVDIANELYFMGNASKITQVIINLLVNAAQSIPLGHVDDNQIKLRAFANGDEICLQICDTGSGIAPEVMDKLFDPFVTTKEVGEGTGLGLAISRQIVSDHQGRIEVESQPNQGSCFSIFLPLHIAENQQHEAQKKVPPRAQKSDRKISNLPSAKPFILLIDDENSVRQTMIRMFKDHAQVDDVSSVAEALKKLNDKKDYDLLLCDLIMPQQTGMDLYRHLLKDWPDLVERLVFISGGAFSDEASDFISQIDRPVLAKPVHKKDLLDLLPKK